MPETLLGGLECFPNLKFHFEHSLIIRIFISNDYIIVREQIIVKFNHFFTTNQTGTNFNVSWVLYLSRQYFSTNFLGFLSIRNRITHKSKSINSFNTHFLSFILIKNKLYCRRRRISMVLLHIFWVFDFLSNQEQVLMHEHNYQQLYYKLITH